MSHTRTSTPHNSPVFIYRGKPCHNVTELPEVLRPEPALCCCTRQGQAAKPAMWGLPSDPQRQDATKAMLEYWLHHVPATLRAPLVLVEWHSYPICKVIFMGIQGCQTHSNPLLWKKNVAVVELGVKSQSEFSANH